MQLLIGRELFPIPSSLPLCAFLISIFSNIIFCRENRRKTSEREMISRRLMHAPIRPADPAKKCGDRYLRLSSLRASRLVVRITNVRTRYSRTRFTRDERYISPSIVFLHREIDFPYFSTAAAKGSRVKSRPRENRHAAHTRSFRFHGI